jgi:hypothetical protein
LWFDRILFGTAGLLGLLIAFLWFATDHQVTVWNLNILWAHPFHLVAVFFLASNKYSGWLKYYFAVNLAVLAVLVLSWPLLPQALPWVIFPLIASLILRSAFLARRSRADQAWVLISLKNELPDIPGFEQTGDQKKPPEKLFVVLHYQISKSIESARVTIGILPHIPALQFIESRFRIMGFRIKFQ